MITIRANDKPSIGQICETEWGRETTCLHCSNVVQVVAWASNSIEIHAHNGIRCDGSQTAPDLATAIDRDNRFNPEEKRIADHVHRWLGSCTGFDEMFECRCYHPGCGKAPSAVLLELRALRILRDPDSELAKYFARSTAAQS